MTDIVERLSQIANLKRGEMLPPDTPGFGIGEWDVGMRALCNDAIAEIVRLRTALEQARAVSGLASAGGQSFADIKQHLRPMTKEQAEDISRRST